MFVASLAIEGMHENAARPTPAIVEHLISPLGEHTRFTGSPFGVEDEDSRDAFVPGAIERFQLLLAAGEAVAIGAEDFEAVGLRGGGGR